MSTASEAFQALIQDSKKDTLNQNWTSTQDGPRTSFGFKMMQKMGWSTGKGLGKDLQGQINSVKVSKKIDNSGLGQVQDSSTGNVGWSETSQSFDAVLAKLNKKYNNITNNNDHKDKKKKRKRELSEGLESKDNKEDEEESSSKEVKDRKRKKDKKKGKEEMTERQMKKLEKEKRKLEKRLKKSQAKAAKSVKRSSIIRHPKLLQAKLGVKQYSSSDLTAILGVSAMSSIASKAS